jgi:hypothetical protein
MSEGDYKGLRRYKSRTEMANARTSQGSIKRGWDHKESRSDGVRPIFHLTDRPIVDLSLGCYAVYKRLA